MIDRDPWESILYLPASEPFSVLCGICTAIIMSGIVWLCVYFR